MAYSNLEFSGRFARIHDLDLSIACFLVIELGSRVGSSFLDDMFEAWVDSISNSGSGCIDLQLDKFLKSQERVGLIIRLIDLVIRDLESMSEVFPREKLNSMLVGVKIKLDVDYRVGLIIGALIGLRKIIIGEG
ncbi:hypothetical protein ABH911_002151 [Pseudomonas protegens]|uniref:hypothetical protein n=1 Tax=Pseudomonas protegens TaxID=380021 RepID=UPI00351131F3